VNLISRTGPGFPRSVLSGRGAGELLVASSAKSSNDKDVPGNGGEFVEAPPEAHSIGQVRRYAVPADGSATTTFSVRLIAAIITSSSLCLEIAELSNHLEILFDRKNNTLVTVIIEET